VSYNKVRESLLSRAGLDHSTLSGTVGLKEIVTVMVTPFGIGGEEEARGELGAWHVSGGLGHLMGGDHGG